MHKLLVPLLLAAIFIAACNIEPKFPFQQVEFDADTFNRERTAWLEQDIGDYTYEFAYGTLPAGPKYIHARVTVEDNTIINIEDLIPDEEWKVNKPDYNDHMESIMRSYGGVTACI